MEQLFVLVEYKLRILNLWAERKYNIEADKYCEKDQQGKNQNPPESRQCLEFKPESQKPGFETGKLEKEIESFHSKRKIISYL